MKPTNPTHPLAWLTGMKFRSMTRREHDWDLILGDNTHITVECLWRLLEGGSVKLTSDDHGQQFGLPKPVDVAVELEQKLANQKVIRADLHEGTLDLDLCFDKATILQIIPTSSGYEAWTVSGTIGLFVAVGGGKLEIFRN